MNLKFDVDFKRTEIAIEGSAVNHIEFTFVMLVHDARYEHFDVFPFSIPYDNRARKTGLRIWVFNQKLCSQHSSGIGVNPERARRIQRLIFSPNDQSWARL